MTDLDKTRAFLTEIGCVYMVEGDRYMTHIIFKNGHGNFIDSGVDSYISFEIDGSFAGVSAAITE